MYGKGVRVEEVACNKNAGKFVQIAWWPGNIHP